MKKALIVMAILIAVVASTTLGGLQTASAFNPQPEPPGDTLPEPITTFFSDVYAALDGGADIGDAVSANIPAPSGR